MAEVDERLEFKKIEQQRIAQIREQALREAAKEREKASR